MLAGACLMFTAASLAIGLFMHSRLLQDFDHVLRTKAEAIVAMVERRGNMIEIEVTDKDMASLGLKDKPDYFLLIFQNGSLAVGGDLPSWGDPPVTTLSAGWSDFRDLRLPNGRRGRVFRMVFRPRVEDPANLEALVDKGQGWHWIPIPAGLDPASALAGLAIARGRDSLDTLLVSMYSMLGAVNVLLLGAVVVFVRSSVRRGLEPLRAINDQLGSMSSDNLDRRVFTPHPPHELQAIIGTMNSLLDRLQVGLERERRFSSDAAHELRTPIAELRTACEMGSRWPEDTEGVRAFFTDIEAVSLRMDRTVANLLELAKCDSRTNAVRNEHVRLAPLIEQCWKRCAVEVGSMRLRMEHRVDPGIVLNIDLDKLTMILRNLIENAVCHGTADSAVVCESVPSASGVALVIENTARDIEPAHMRHLFDRFWRKDTARTGDHHAGLGLAIVKALTDFLGIRLIVTLRGHDRFNVRLIFPVNALVASPSD